MTAEPQQTEPEDSDTALPDDAIGPRLWGVVDVVRKSRIAGWAIDRANSAAGVEIDIRYEGRVIRTVTADRLRADLVKGGVGTGNYGFVADLDPPIDPDFAFSVTATARTADGTSAELKRVGGAGDAASPETRLVRRIFADVAALRQAAPAMPDTSADAALRATVEKLNRTVERIELAQVRLKAHLASVAPTTPPPSVSGLRMMVLLAVAVSLASLGIGIASLWQG